MTVSSALPVETGGPGYRHRWMVLVVVLVADVMDLVDATVANLAGPSIRADLGGSATTLQWVLAAYTLTFAVGLVTSARVGDLVGRRRMFLVGMAGFTIASLLCGLAPTAGLLIAARVAQGFFGAVMLPQGLAMVKSSFAPEDLQKAFIPFGPAMGLSAVAAPILGGFLLDADVLGTGWRAVFLINVPVGAVATYLSWRYLPEVRSPGSASRLDPRGALLLTAASGLLIYPLVQGRELGWPWWAYAMMAASAVVFALFVTNERRSADPIIEPSLFRHRGFVAGTLFLATFFVAMAGFMLVLSLFVQLGLGYEPLRAGLAMSPWAVGIAVGATLSGAALGPRFGRHVLHAGLVVLGLGMLLLWTTVGRVGASLTGWDLAPALLVAGVGCGLIFAPLFDIILADLGEHEVGTGSGLLNALQQFGGAVGVAVLGTLFLQWIPTDGWVDATRAIILVTLGCYAVSFAAAFLLPMRAREDALH
jgi:EmrB/QacA subfamily drug resistance transporter